MELTRLLTVMALAATAGVAQAAPAPASPAGHALLVDANRDGVVNAADAPLTQRATIMQGALVLPNIDDDSDRCNANVRRGFADAAAIKMPMSPTTGKADVARINKQFDATDARLHSCFDGADLTVNGSEDAKDLAPMVLNARGARTATVRVAGEGAAHSHVFMKTPGGWTLLRPTDTIDAEQLRRPVQLGVEATGPAMDRAKWDGTLTVNANVDGRTLTARLHVAPVLTHNHTQTAQGVLISPRYKALAPPVPGTPSPGSPNPQAMKAATGRIIADFRQLARDLRLPGGVTVVGDTDEWTQDYVEPMYASVPAPGGKVHAMRILMRSPQRRAASQKLFRLQGRDVAVFRVVVPKGFQSIDSMGNFEVIPPFQNGSTSFPMGRVITGFQKSERPSPAMKRFVEAQGMPSPIVLDNGWLGVGHVDEYIQFLPAPGTPRGFRIAVADPKLGLQVLRDAKAAGGGAAPVSSHIDPATNKLDDPMTVDAALSDPGVASAQAFASENIERNLATVLAATGVPASEVVRVPSLYTVGTGPTAEELRAQLEEAKKSPWFANMPPAVKKQTIEQYREQIAGVVRNGQSKSAGNMLPAAINNVVMSPKVLMVARQFGPIVGGSDVFEAAVRKAYAAAGMDVRFVDDWQNYHLGGGELHCGSNTLRDMSQRWWKSPPAGK